MLFEPGERKTTVYTQRQEIQKLLEDSRSIIFVYEDHERLVGFIAGLGGNVARNRHSMYIVIGILQEYAGNGMERYCLKDWNIGQGNEDFIGWN
jgi:hypothetical protein